MGNPGLRANAPTRPPRSRLDNLDELRTFIAVVDAGGLAAAATHLGVTANAVSRRPATLEERLGRRLIHRTTRRMVVTEEGQRFYGRCRVVLAELEEAEREVAGADGVFGTLRVGIHADLASADLFTALREMLAAATTLRVQLVTATGPIDPMQLGLDVAVFVGTPPASSLIATPLGALSWVLTAAPSYVESAGRPRVPADLVRHECLRVLRERPETHWHLRRGTGRARRFPVSGRFETNDPRALVAALHAGLGIGIRLLTDADADIAAGRLVRVLPQWQWASIPMFALTPPGRQRVPRVRALLDLLRQATHRMRDRA